MKNRKTDDIKIPTNASKSEIEEMIANEKKLLAQEEIKIKKLQKKMLIFGIILAVLIIAYIIFAIINKRIV